MSRARHAPPTLADRLRAILSFLDTRLTRWVIVATYTYFCAIILIEVVQRHLFGLSSPWGEMTARYAFVYLAYVSAAEAIRQGRHIRVELVPSRLPPRARKALRVYTDALTTLLAGVVLWYSLKVMGIQLAVDIRMSSLDVNMAVAQAALPLGMGLMLCRLAQNWLDPLEDTMDTDTAAQTEAVHE